MAQGTAAETYFRAQLAGMDEPTAPFEILSVAAADRRVSYESALDEDLAAEVRALPEQLGYSVSAVFHAAWALVVSASSASTDIVFGTGHRGGTTAPVRVNLQGLAVASLLDTLNRGLPELAKYESVPPELIRRCCGIAEPAPIFTALLRFTADDTSHLEPDHLLPLTLTVTQREYGWNLEVRSDARIQPRRIVTYVQTALRALLDAVMRAPATPALTISILPKDEWRQVIEQFNDVEADFPRDRTVHELFELQAARTPQAIALEDDDRVLTYAQLNARANQLAHYLLAQGIKPAECVAVHMARSIEGLIAELAVLKSGGAFVPIDPELPDDRRTFLIQTARARCVLDHSVVSSSALSAFPTENPQLRLPSSAPAYVMYTSGSTGTPKGVVVAHRGINRLIINNGYAELTAEDCLGHCSNPAFDASTFEIWGALLVGGRVAVVPRATLMNPESFAGFLVRRGVTVLVLTVGLFVQYMESLRGAFGKLRYLLVGGDVVDPHVVRRLLSEGPPRYFLNAYGPTECTTFATTYRFTAEDDLARGAPIGKPISNTQLYILDRNLQPVPLGVLGEIYLAGVGVASAYLNRPELTAERFIANPFGGPGNERMYRTGDLGRWRTDGNVEFAGRRDRQVKVRGYRIEIGEIETALMQHPSVKQSVVVALGSGAGDKHLVGYVAVSGQDAAALQPRDLRTHLARTLPTYMIPAAFVILDELPLTQNGKIDRAALPKPSLESHARADYEPPQNEVETMLAKLWQDVLKLERVGRNDDFFELGGHSLQGMRLITALAQQLGAQDVHANVFQYPTVAKMTALVRKMQSSTDAQLPSQERMSQRDGPLRLSPYQQWRYRMYHSRGTETCVAHGVRCVGPLDIPALQSAFRQIIHAHESLRMTVAVERGQVVQRIGDVPAEVLDIRHVVEDVDAEARQLLEALASQPVDLAVGPLFSAVLLRASEQLNVLFVVVHSICWDGISAAIFWRELWQMYGTFAAGASAPVPQPAMQPADYFRWQEQLDASWRARHQSYWQRRLAEGERLRLFPQPGDAADRSVTTASFPVSAAVTAGLRATCSRQRSSLGMAVFASFAALLMRWCGKSDVVFSVHTTGRLHAAVENSIGRFQCPLLLRLELHANDTFADLLQRVAHEYAAAYEHHDLGRLLSSDIGSKLALNPNLNWLPAAMISSPASAYAAVTHASGASALRVESFATHHVPPRDIEWDGDPQFVVLEMPEGLLIAAAYRANQATPAQMQRLQRNFQMFLERMATDADSQVLSVACVP